MPRLEDNILKGLEVLGYKGPLNKFSHLQASTEIGQKDLQYTQLVHFLTSEIRSLLGIDEEVNPIESPEDSASFVMEITSFLNELNCPYKCLTKGFVSERLQSYSDRLLLLDYLIAEVNGARILQEKKQEKKFELKLQETPEAADMRQILQILRFPKPPPNISIKVLFDKLSTTIPLVLKKAGADLVGQGIFKGFLSDKQWEILKGVQSDLQNEYKIRREMLLTRLDVTVQSFQWSDKTKDKEQEFEKIYHESRKVLHANPDVDLSDLIGARTDIAVIEKTSSASVRKNTQTSLSKFIIGEVPDRGGRSWEQVPPPPEMPSWQKNRTVAGGATTSGGSNAVSGGSPTSRGRGGPNSRGWGGNSNSRSSNEFYGQGYQGRGGYHEQKRYGGNHYNSQYDSRGGSSSYESRGNNYYENRSYNYNRRDSGGYLGGPPDYQQSKRPKTYDNFQANKTTYADQYVQDNQQNQQYHRGGYQRGRSNYHRGGGGYR